MNRVSASWTRWTRRASPGEYRRWFLLASVAAAVTVVAVAIAVVVTGNAPTRPAATVPSLVAAPTASAASGNAPGGNDVPEYYVARMQADKPYLVVGDTFTGKKIATISAPANEALQAVYGGADDDRTFIVTGNRLRGLYLGPDWYATLGSFTCEAAQGWQLITVVKGAAAGQGSSALAARCRSGTPRAAARPTRSASTPKKPSSASCVPHGMPKAPAT